VTAKLSLRSTVVLRRDREVLRVEALDVRAGEVLAVLGPNGAGKSTLLQLLALLAKPSEGTVLFDGSPVAGRELALRRRMAVVLQDPLLLNKSLADNVGLGLALRNVPRRERKERVARALARFGIDALAARRARSLSGGEAQRASLARAFALEPEVLLLDEPFGALDQPTREALLAELASALGETGVTTVFVTHERAEAARLADRLAVVFEGRLRQVGPTQEVFAQPVDEAVAAYVGVETLAPARLVEAREGLATFAVGGAAVEAAVDGFVGREALVCLRPEDIVLSPAGAWPLDSARNHLRGIVRAVTPAGAEVRVEVDCGFPLVARITRRSLEELELETGSEVIASFKATAVHLVTNERAAN